jgi:hypothetical protein
LATGCPDLNAHRTSLAHVKTEVIAFVAETVHLQAF